MYGKKRSYTLVRTLILASASLAIVGVMFAMYQSMSGRPRVRPDREGTVAEGGVAAPLDAEQGVPVGQGARLGGGRRGSLTLYDENSDRAKAVVAYQGWEPLDDGENRFHVTEPAISLRTPAGQLVEITAHSGLLQLKNLEGSRLDLRRAKLLGDVRIRIDRLTERQRAALPEEQRADPGPERLITVEFDEVDFDMEYARLETDGRFTVRSMEADIEGTGLALRYNAFNSTVEYLEARSDGKITVRGLGALLRLELPGAEGLTVTTQPAVAVEAPASPPPRPTTKAAPQEDLPLLVLDRDRRPSPRQQTVRYHAVFAGDVTVRQREDRRLTGELLAETLELLFDFGQEQRDAAEARVGGKAAGDAPDAGPARDEDRGHTELAVSWTGPLVVNVLEAPQEETDETRTARGTRITASGPDVRLRQIDRGMASCSKLVFHEDTERVWLYGGPDQPVTIESSDGGRLVGREMALDMQGGTGRIVGPGQVSDTGSSLEIAGGAGRPGQRKVDIRFQKEANLTFDEATVQAVDPDTGAAVERTRQYLRGVVFVGAVSMMQAGDSITGRRVEIELSPPAKEGSFADKIERLRAEGGVSLVHGEDFVRCGRIDVEMGADEGGRVAPRRARAYEQIKATHGNRSITATQSMFVELRSFRVPRDPWDLGKARAEAVRRGIDPTTVDWEQQRVRYESQDRFRPGLLHLEAEGEVRVRDPKQKLHVTAATLDCTFSDGQNIDRAHVAGPGNSPAHVELSDFSITGHDILLDVPAESAEVPGRGRLTFLTDRDLDGRRLADPLPVAVTWGLEMTYNGRQSRALFSGSVHAATQESAFDCGELVVEFADPQPRPGEATAGTASSREEKDRWWIFTPLAEAVFGGEQDSAGLGEDFSKDPVFLRASGGAVARTTRVSAGSGRLLSRGRIEGPQILVDLRSEIMTVEGGGNLLIEDYELPAGTPGTLASRRTPLGGMGIRSPWQTFILWTGQMSYYFGRQAAVFDQGVEMVHRSGSAILMGEEVLGEVATALTGAGQQGGQNASLTCGQLVVQFEDRQAGGRRARGAGSMSGYDLRQFEAKQSVHFQDSGISVIAQQITYDAAREEMAIRGSEAAPAQIIDQRSAFRDMKGPVFYWNLRTGRIDAPRSTLIGR